MVTCVQVTTTLTSFLSFCFIPYGMTMSFLLMTPPVPSDVTEAVLLGTLGTLRTLYYECQLTSPPAGPRSGQMISLSALP